MVFELQPILVGRIFYPGRSHGCCPVRATGGSPPCGRYLLAPLNGNKEGSKCLLVLRVKPTPTGFPTNSLYTPMDNTPLHSISTVCHPWGKKVLLHSRVIFSLASIINLYRLSPPLVTHHQEVVNLQLRGVNRKTLFGGSTDEQQRNWYELSN